MSLFETIKKVFAAKEDPQGKPQRAEVGYASGSMIYGGKDFSRYNPDVLYSYKGAQVYDKMLTDDQVKAVVEFKTGAIASRGWYFDVQVDDTTGEENSDHREIADFFDVCLNKMDGNVTDKLIEILSAIKYGFSIAEKVYQGIEVDGRSYWGVKDIKLRPFSTFLHGISTDKHGNVITIKQRVAASEVELPLQKIIHFVHRPEIDRQYGESDLRAAYRPYWAKDIAIKFQNIHLERHSGGFIWASVDATKGSLTATDASNLERVLDNISAHTAIRVPASVTLNAIQPMRTDAYAVAIAQYDKAIAKALLVPNLLGLSEQGDVGSYSQSATQLEVFFWVLDLIAGRLADVLNEQLFRQLAELNFGTDDYPRFCFEPISEEKKKVIMQTWADLVSKGAVTKSDSDEAHVRKLMGFPDKTEEEPPATEPSTEDQSQDMEPTEQPDNDQWADTKADADKIKKEFSDRPWLTRCNFAEIEKNLNESEELSSSMSSIMAKVRLSLESQIERVCGARSFGNVRPGEIVGIYIPKSLMSGMRKEVRAAFAKSIDTAYSQARKELPKKIFARTSTSMDKDDLEKFMASRVMKITGIVEQRVLDAIQRLLENALKYDYSLKEVIRRMMEDTDLVALLPEIDAAGRAINIPARLENIARTNIADAVNQARQSLFGDPALKGFVQAYEYSAILDDRTTEVCEKLHGKIQKDWGGYTPPNHYQCRSLLIPVTQVDDWSGKEDRIPAGVQPMKGFV